MRVVVADDGVVFDGATPEERPLGGAESAFVALAEAMAACGAEVIAAARGARALTKRSVEWRDVGQTLPSGADLFIANRNPHLLWREVSRRRPVFWLHNPAQFLRKPRYAAPLLVKRPIVVFAGASHRATAPAFLFGARATQIPLGVERVFLETARAPGIPPPRLIFTSNPIRGLSELVELWRTRIHPRAPDAELHVFSGPEVYAAHPEWAARMQPPLEAARATPGVVMRGPHKKDALALELGQARAMAYLGDVGETFCLALAEAQAMGVPGIVKPVGAVAERVIAGRTGAVAQTDAAFADHAIRILTDDALWASWSAAAMAQRPALAWSHAAERFLALTQS